MSRALTSQKNAWEKISISPLRYYVNCVHCANGFDTT